MPTLQIIAILGPTASGKSALALRLSEDRGGEIVAADALMVYRGFDIGTNKPSVEERARVPHHLIDVCEWNQPMHAGAYAERAAEAVAAINGRGKIAIVVAGTYLYYRALVYGLLDVPPSDPVERQALIEREAKEPGALAREVLAVDPDSHREAGNGKNLPRLVRALEIFRATGEPASRLRARHGFAAPRFQLEVTLLAPEPRALARRIDARVGEMLARGWVEEVRALRASGVPLDARPMQAVGYREIARALDEGAPIGDALMAEIAQKTRQYARRQRSFFKQEKTATVIAGFGD